MSGRLLVRSNLYYTPPVPRARPFLLEAVKRGLVGHEAGGAGISTHAGMVARPPNGSASAGRPSGSAILALLVSNSTLIPDSLNQNRTFVTYLGLNPVQVIFLAPE